MKIECLSVGPLGTNCYIILKNKDALIIDPGGEPERIIEVINQNDVIPRAILLTHAHFDHIGAVGSLRKYFNIDVYLHHTEHDWLENPHLNGSQSFIGKEIVTNLPEKTLSPGVLTIDTFVFEVAHTPGHSPGSVSFIFRDSQFIVGGDVLFNQGIGRTDLPGGNMEQLETSIRSHFYTLNGDYIVYPGHGPKTTIKNEKNSNPFIRN